MISFTLYTGLQVLEDGFPKDKVGKKIEVGEADA